jgi:putative salt-induced outer membrane protein YdiY
MTRHISLIAILLLLICGEAIADQLTLTNGDRITGKLVKADDKSLVFKSDLIGEFTIPLGSVDKFTSDQPVYINLADGRTINGLLTAQADKVVIKSTSDEVSVTRSQIVVIRSEAEQRLYESSLNPGWLEQWSGSANLGIALTKGNSDTTNLALGMALSRETRHDNTSVYAAAIYNRETTSGVSRTVASTLRFGGRYDRDIKDRWFGYGFTDLERNRLQLLNLRWVIGGGVGYHAIRNERTKLDLLGGLAMNREYFSGFSNDRTSLEAQAGQTLSHQFNSRVGLKEQLFFFPNLSEGGEYRINFDTALVADITSRIGWQITLSDRYLSNPPSGFKKNDLILTSGVRVKLGTIK